MAHVEHRDELNGAVRRRHPLVYGDPALALEPHARSHSTLLDVIAGGSTADAECAMATHVTEAIVRIERTLLNGAGGEQP